MLKHQLIHPTINAIIGAAVLFGAAFANDRMTRQRQRDAAAAVRAANEAAIRYVDGGETIGPLGMAGSTFGRWQVHQDRARAEQQALGEGFEDNSPTPFSTSK